MKEQDNLHLQSDHQATPDADLTRIASGVDEGLIGEGSILSHRYLLTKRLASGGTCDVYQARDLVALGVTSGDQSFLAVKVLRDDLVEAVGDAGLVLNEALLTRQLNHPAIIKIFDYHCDQSGSRDRHFVTMELVEGETLADLLARTPGRQLSYWHAMAILEPVASALQAAHEKGIVHSDIKPGNILIGHDGQVKIIDFGTARGLMHALKRKPWRKGRQTIHTSVGADLARPYLAFTHEYASLEVINDEPPSPEDDVYALACVLYEALSGRKPGATDSEVFASAAAASAALAKEIKEAGVDAGQEDKALLESDHAQKTAPDDVPIDVPMSVQSSAETRVKGVGGGRRVWRKPGPLNYAQWRVLKKGLSAQKSHRYRSVDEFVVAFKKARHLPKKILAAVVLIPTLVWGVDVAQTHYAAHRATMETWAQSDLQLVQATQYSDVVAQAPVESLPQVLSDLESLPSLLRSGVLADSAELNLARIRDYVNERLAYNALAVSSLGVKLGQSDGSLKRLQRTNAEFVDYQMLTLLLESFGQYYPDSVQLSALLTQLGQAQAQEQDALRVHWNVLWSGAIDEHTAANLYDLGMRLIAIVPDESIDGTLVLPAGALDSYKKAVGKSFAEANLEAQRSLKALAEFFDGNAELHSKFDAVWAPYLAKTETAALKPTASEPSSTTAEKSAQQAVIAKELLFVANVWRDVDLLSAPDRLRKALASVDLEMKSAAARPLVSALVERIDLKISYYNNTDRFVSTERLAALRDQLSVLL